MSIGNNVARESDAFHLVSYDFGHSGTCRWEGVENQETLNRLGDFGCDIAQGFSISRPLPGDSFRAWEALSTWH